MVKIIAIGGEPGAGKSTLMRKIIDQYKIDEFKDDFKLVPYHQKDNLYVLGKYEDDQVFAGTDRMSMAVQPEAIKFLSSIPDNSIVLFEGDRLFNNSFLEHCNDNFDLSIIYLSTQKKERELRYESRGSNQDETWLRGRETKVANILSNLNLLFIIEHLENNTYDEQNTIVSYINTVIHDANN